MHVNGRLSSNLLFVKRVGNFVFVNDLNGLIPGLGTNDSNQFLTVVSLLFFSHRVQSVKDHLGIALGESCKNSRAISSYGFDQMWFFDLSGLLADLKLKKLITKFAKLFLKLKGLSLIHI